MTSKWNSLLIVGFLIVLTLLFFWKILLSNLILSGVDVFLYFYPYKAYTSEVLRQGQLPLWNPYLFMGAPLLANSQVGLFYPPNWLFIWLDPPRQVSWTIGLHIALAGIFMLAYSRRMFRLDWPAALTAALLFALGGYLGAQVEHVNQLQAAAWLPALFLLYDIGLQRPSGWRYFLGLAVIVAMILLAGHTQTAFISLFGLGLYGLWQAIFERNAPSLSKIGHLQDLRGQVRRVAANLVVYLLPLAIVSLLAVAIAAVQIIPTAELSDLSIRGGGLTFREVVSFSLRPTNLHYALLPPLGLDLSQILGQAFSEWVAYIGISGLILAVLGTILSVWRTSARRFVWLAVIGLTLSLGIFTGPLYFGLFHLVPGFNLFRVPARWLLLYAFSISLLAGFGMQALLTPDTTGERLRIIRKWLDHTRWRWLLPGSLLGFLLALIAWKTPPPITLLAWFLIAAVMMVLIRSALRSRWWAPPLVLMLLVGELFWAAQMLNYNKPTAPQAYHSMRNTIAFLRSADGSSPPDRFLSLSGITYDPGDLKEMEQIFGDSLSTQAIYDLIVATKQKEVLFFNLPMIYRLFSVDGYDGGVLPLRRFVSFQRLFLSEDNLSIDGRLREKLKFIPANRLLTLTNTRWIITDKQFDAWIDGIFYDLQFPAYLAPQQAVTTADIPPLEATAIGMVSHLEGGAGLNDGTPVAEVTVNYAAGPPDIFVLQAGKDTAEGNYSESNDIAHQQATVGVTWPYEQAGVDYITVRPLSTLQKIVSLQIKSLLPAGQFVLRGLSLINEPTATSRSIILSTEGDYRQVHSGDVKIYENNAVLPRAFVVHQTEIVPDEDAAIAHMKSPSFDPAKTLVKIAAAGEVLGTAQRGRESPEDRATITSYAAEQIEIETNFASPGWLVLTDSYYPGWQATIDQQPVDILPVNLLFRAIPIPSGEHQIRFEFRPRSVWQGALVSTAALLVVIAGLVWSIWYHR
jgi:hypothetical protein